MTALAEALDGSRDRLEVAAAEIRRCGRRLHPGVHTHLVAATVQLEAAIRLADPANDQTEPDRPGRQVVCDFGEDMREVSRA